MQRRSIPIHELVCVLDSDKVTALSFFHAFHGSDNTSAFAHKGKKSM